jgi:hypothetical protein
VQAGEALARRFLPVFGECHKWKGTGIKAIASAALPARLAASAMELSQGGECSRPSSAGGACLPAVIRRYGRTAGAGAHLLLSALLLSTGIDPSVRFLTVDRKSCRFRLKRSLDYLACPASLGPIPLRIESIIQACLNCPSQHRRKSIAMQQVGSLTDSSMNCLMHESRSYESGCF